MVSAVSEAGFRDEFLNDVGPDVAARIAPDSWRLAWSQMDTPARRKLAVALMEGLEENLEWFPRYQASARASPADDHRLGPNDGYMPEAAALAYRRDLPDAEVHLLDDAGHWLLETHLAEAIETVRPFLARHLPSPLNREGQS